MEPTPTLCTYYMRGPTLRQPRHYNTSCQNITHSKPVHSSRNIHSVTNPNDHSNPWNKTQTCTCAFLAKGVKLHNGPTLRNLETYTNNRRCAGEAWRPRDISGSAEEPCSESEFVIEISPPSCALCLGWTGALHTLPGVPPITVQRG